MTTVAEQQAPYKFIDIQKRYFGYGVYKLTQSPFSNKAKEHFVYTHEHLNIPTSSGNPNISINGSLKTGLHLYFFGFNDLFYREVLERFVATQQANENPQYSSPEELLEEIVRRCLGTELTFTHTQS